MRRKLVWILWLIVLIVALSGASAEEGKRKMNFMGMDWYITVDEFENNLAEKGIDFKLGELVSKNETTDFWACFMGGVVYDNDGGKTSQNIRFVYVRNDYKSARLGKVLTKVAGYEVSYIHAVFAPSIIDSYSGAPYKLMQAGYTIYGELTNGVSEAKIYDDLKRKLTVLYGNAVKEESEIFYDKVAYWISDDNTGIKLQYDDGHCVKLEYGVTNDKEYFEELFSKARQKKEREEDIKIDLNYENYDGL